jgi:NAD(P)-dependent dehydrogenase (short-subunit alcohol dehydrogenase family)
LAPWAIDVVCIEPGMIATPIWETSLDRARRLLDAFPERARELYGRQLAARVARAERNLAGGIPPERVAATVYKALTVRRPRTRYAVGVDAKVAIHLIAHLPDRCRDWLIARQR